jgi:hypothetical protein
MAAYNPPARPAKKLAATKADQLGRKGVDADGIGQGFVVAYGHERQPENGIDDAVQE